MIQTSEPQPSESPSQATDERHSEFEALARQKRQGRIGEFLEFLMDNKKWWILPILVVALLLGLIVVLGPALQALTYTL